MKRHLLGFAALLSLAAPVAAKDSLGVFDSWAAFRDPAAKSCYAIAKASSAGGAYATIGTWPSRNVRGQVHFRLSRALAEDGAITLRIGERSFALIGNGTHAWARDKSMDAAIVAAMRSAGRMTLRADGENGRRIVNSFNLSGAATAMDAATVGCARNQR